MVGGTGFGEDPVILNSNKHGYYEGKKDTHTKSKTLVSKKGGEEKKNDRKRKIDDGSQLHASFI
jgi:hypothetical protein